MAVPNGEDSVSALAQQVGLMAEAIGRMAEEMRRENLIRLHGLFVDQLDRAMGDPSLADVLSGLDGLSEERRRQMFFANLQYGLIVLSYRIGAVDRGELLGHLKVLSRNPVFVEYWKRTVEPRGSLPPESLEARAGRAVDVIMEDRLDDLDEWWVVGTDSEDLST
ncbi:DUF6082 family protein [Streptomyces sp. NPDC001617]